MDTRTETEFLDFVAQATPGLFRVAYALAGDQQGAEDLLQTALERVAARWRRVRDPVAYVKRVMYHETVSWWRSWRKREVPVAAPADRLATDDPAHAVVLQQALQAALRQLPPRQRAVLVLRYLEDRSEADVAVMLGCSPKTVASQASRALRTLRSRYAGTVDLVPLKETT